MRASRPAWTEWALGAALAILMGIVGYLNAKLDRAHDRIGALEVQMAAANERERALSRSLREVRRAQRLPAESQATNHN